LAAGGPKSAELAARKADGIITSVKAPADTIERVCDPARQAAKEAGRPAPPILATRWSIFAASPEDAWQALLPWRGLRAPGRLEAVDPADLRTRADALPRDEVLGQYTVVSNAEEVVAAYRPLVEDLGADVVTFQMTSVDQEGLIERLGSDVLPELRKTGSG
jgi:coenzyme F420-dependent glucose-6-phosphate dehydrogenase